VDSIISRQDQAEERMSETEDKIKGILYSDNHKLKIWMPMITHKKSKTQSKDQT
jgi:hypothetical protein